MFFTHNPYYHAVPEKKQSTDATWFEETSAKNTTAKQTPPPGAVHGSLATTCLPITIPDVEPLVEQPLPFKYKLLFVGQIRMEITAGQFHWLLQYTAGVSPINVKSRGLGSFLLYLRDENDANAVRNLHKRVLFDVNNICWFAQDVEAVDAMLAYTRDVLPSVSRANRVPRDSLVVEEKKAENARSPKHSNGAPMHWESSWQPMPSMYSNPIFIGDDATSSSYGSCGSCGSLGDSDVGTPKSRSPPPPSYSATTAKWQ